MLRCVDCRDYMRDDGMVRHEEGPGMPRGVTQSRSQKTKAQATSMLVVSIITRSCECGRRKRRDMSGRHPSKFT